MSTGADLERAVLAAAKQYQAQDRAELAKQHTPQLHGGGYAGKASVDFKGWHGSDRRPLYAEAKATSDGNIYFRNGNATGNGIKEKQLEAMRDAVARGIDMILIADFVPQQEVYVVAAHHIAMFAALPWRKSLSLYWCRAYGEVARVTFERGKRRVWFLDTAPHPLRLVSQSAVESERADAPLVELYPAELAPSKKRAERFAQRPAPGTPEHRDYLKGLILEGANNAQKRGARAQPKWKPRRKYGH